MSFQIGDSVSWFVKEGGQQTAPIIEIDDNHLTALTWIGDHLRLSLSEAHEVNDSRMTNLRILDVEDHKEAELVRKTYLEDYLRRVEANKSYLAEKSTNNTTQTSKRKKTTAAGDSELVKTIISAVVELGVASKSEILEKIGREISASEWNKAVDAVLKTRKVNRRGKKRGTRYFDPTKEG